MTEQVISTGTTTDGYEYFISCDGKSTSPSNRFRKNLKTGEIEDLSDNSN